MQLVGAFTCRRHRDEGRLACIFRRPALCSLPAAPRYSAESSAPGGSPSMSEDLHYAVLHELVEPARRNLPRGTWDYLMGGAETETTQERNRAAIDALAFRPRVLRDVGDVDTSGKVLGRQLRLPVILAPLR